MWGWLLSSVVVVLFPLLWGQRLLHRALPKQEYIDFAKSRIRQGSHGPELLSRLLELKGPVGGFVRDCVSRDFADRVDLICERLADVDAETKQVGAQFSMLTRAVLGFGGLGAVFILIEAVNEYFARDASVGLALWGVLPLVLTALAAFWCHWTGRAVRERLEDRRRCWDRLSGLLTGPLMSESNVEVRAVEASQQVLRGEGELGTFEVER